MIFITGDVHGMRDTDRFNSDNFRNVINKPGNIVIITGDFGITWNPETLEECRRFYSQFDCEFLFIDGNNENFDILNQMPVDEYAGGKVHVVGDNIRHLMRGEIYNIEGTTILAFGGADSYDSPVITSWTNRVSGVSWWQEETPTIDEFQNAMANLQANGNKVDIILSHETTSQNVNKYFSWSITSTTCQMLDEIERTTDYKLWFFGHHHYDMTLDNNQRCIFNDFVDVSHIENIPYVGNTGMEE